MHNDRLTGLLMSCVFSALIGGIVGWYLKPCPCESTSVPVAASVRVDTITKVVTHDPVFVEGPAHVIYVRDTITRRDTIIETRPFVASLDTVVQRDTIGVLYRFPQHTFSVAIRQSPDSIRYETRTITMTNYEQRPWWIDALTHVGAVALGYGAGRVAP